MRQLMIFFFTFLMYVNSFSQARITITDYQKIQEPAIEYDLPYAEKNVDNAIQDKLEKMGYKGKTNGGFMVYRAVRLPEFRSEAYDLYFKTSQRNKKDKVNSVVTLMISKGPGSFVSEANDAALMDAGKKYLEGLGALIDAYELELEIQEQAEVLKKQEKKTYNLVNDSLDLARKKKNLDDQIAELLLLQAAQNEEREKQKRILDTLTSRRRQ